MQYCFSEGRLNYTMSIKSLMIYFFKDYKRSNKYIAPLLTYMILMGVVYAVKPCYVMTSYTATCIIIYIIAAWIAVTFVDSEDIVQQQLTILHFKKENVYYFSKIVFVYFFILILSVITIFYPILLGCFIRKIYISDIVIAFMSHAVIGLLGTALGSLFNCRIIKDKKIVVLFLSFILLVSVIRSPLVQALPLFKWITVILPPVYLIIDKLSSINYVNLENSIQLVYALTAAVIYSIILIFVFIKSVK